MTKVIELRNFQSFKVYFITSYSSCENFRYSLLCVVYIFIKDFRFMMDFLFKSNGITQKSKLILTIKYVENYWVRVWRMNHGRIFCISNLNNINEMQLYLKKGKRRNEEMPYIASTSIVYCNVYFNDHERFSTRCK